MLLSWKSKEEKQTWVRKPCQKENGAVFLGFSNLKFISLWLELIIIYSSTQTHECCLMKRFLRGLDFNICLWKTILGTGFAKLNTSFKKNSLNGPKQLIRLCPFAKWYIRSFYGIVIFVLSWIEIIPICVCI